MRDHRIGLDLFTDLIDVLERHGFTRGDDQHAGRAIFLIGDLARIYEGSQHHPCGPSISQVPSPPEPLGQDSRDTVILARDDVSTVFTALDIAADCKRDRAEMCADCHDQSCLSCQDRLRDARAYDQMADRLLHTAQPARAAGRNQPGPSAPVAQTDHAAEMEAGQ